MVTRVLDGRYELLERIGSGGMASVWRGVDRRLGRVVAIKLLYPGFVGMPTFADRFQREARHAASLSHPNIVAVHDWGTDGDTPYIVMELVPGEGLDVVLARGSLNLTSALNLAKQVLLALQHAHDRGIIHRDIKPANILLAGAQVRVADFGIAKSLTDLTLTATGHFLGTPSYSSPEQTRGEATTPASDIYAVGCLIFECLTGHPPFQGSDPLHVALQHRHDKAPAISATLAPAHVAAAVARALEKDPLNRFPSAPAMLTALGVGAQGDSAYLSSHAGRSATSVLPIGEAPTLASAAAAPTDASQFQRWSKRVLVGGVAAAVVTLGSVISVEALRSDSRIQPIESTSPSSRPTASRSSISPAPSSSRPPTHGIVQTRPAILSLYSLPLPAGWERVKTETGNPSRIRYAGARGSFFEVIIWPERNPAYGEYFADDVWNIKWRDSTYRSFVVTKRQRFGGCSPPGPFDDLSPQPGCDSRLDIFARLVQEPRFIGGYQYQFQFAP